MTVVARTNAGLGVDSKGGPVIDPTENVLSLVEAAVKRQDDLRIASEKLVEAELRHVRLTEELRAAHQHSDDVLRAEHQRELSEKEANRLDAIRQVDVLNGTAAAKAASDAIAVLAATTATNAEKLRNDLNATATLMAKQTADVATAMATQTATTVGAITDRLSALEKSSYQGAGRSAVADPALADLMGEMKTMLRSQAVGAGKTQGVAGAWAIASAVLALVVSVAAIVFADSRAPAAAPQPIIVQVPAPAAPATVTTPPPSK